MNQTLVARWYSRRLHPIGFVMLVVSGFFAGEAVAQSSLLYTGVNLSGAEFGTKLPGLFGVDYTYPTNSEVDYFIGKGMNTFRIPFRWERLQRTLDGPLDATELTRLTRIVDYATSRGAQVVLDPHNFARYHGRADDPTQGLIGTEVPDSAFANFWSQLATTFSDNRRVIFNLINEPHTMPTEQWVNAANTAIDAIRATGATNLALVPGNAWTGAWTWSDNWYGTPNAVAMLQFRDPLENFAFDVHQYLDADGSGTSPEVGSVTRPTERLSGFTAWLRENNQRAFLGEWAVARQMVGTQANQIGDEAMQNLLQHLEANADVWLGWAWWSAGPWWGDYMFSLEPTGNQQDRPQMDVLESHLAGLFIPNGDFNQDSIIDASDIDLLSAAIRTQPSDSRFDVNGNGRVDTLDRAVWIDDLARTYAGDANLDGQFSSEDLVAVFVAGEYEDRLVGNSTWSSGDWTGDGEFDSQDFLYAFRQGGYNAGPRTAVQSVPEPVGTWIVAVVIIPWILARTDPQVRGRPARISTPIN